MVEVPKDRLLPPSSWYLWKTGKKMILFSCPRCGHIMPITEKVSSIGLITKPIQCAKKCGFDKFIRLMEWNQAEYVDAEEPEDS
jgi:predicted RNA-binding Zn-ribbon protein involved in translation (DUF1610 family)